MPHEQSSPATPALISRTEELQTLCNKLSALPFITVDTEFMREHTYYSKLCLIQLGAIIDKKVEGYLIDPLSPDIDLSSFLELMTNDRVVKVFHAARQDLETIWNIGQILPEPLFDTQVAAAVCSFGESVSYEQLVNDLTGNRIDKSSRFTDWSQRPLKPEQIRYALSDVTHLVAIYTALNERLEKSGRSFWVQEEMAALLSPSLYEMKPEDAWQRLAGRMRKQKDIPILVEVAAWREKEAQSRNVPRGRILKDDVVADIASAAPKDADDLKQLRSLPRGFENSKYASAILDAVQRGQKNLSSSGYKLPIHKRKESSALTELLKVLLKSVSEKEGVAARIIASQEDLYDLACHESETNPLLSGWRRQIFGEQALALKSGKSALTVRKKKIVIIPT